MDDNQALYLKLLDPSDSTVGGGTASAIAGAMAASLVAMVAGLSGGRGEVKPEGWYQAIWHHARVLAASLLDGGRQDAEAFGAIRAAHRLPKATANEKATRSTAIQLAIQRATESPLANARACHQVRLLAARLSEHANPNAASDLECAEYLAQAGLLGCVANVRVNVPRLEDATIAAELSSAAEGLLIGPIASDVATS